MLRGSEWIIGGLIVWRLVDAFSVVTFFQPDEYWQSLEPAHRLVFGYGYLTWEWREGLRSAAHPLVYAAIYQLSEWFGIDVVVAPKVFQALVAAIGDLYTYKLAATLVGKDLAGWALVASVFSGANWFLSVRTFSNSLEMVLTAVAMSYWPWKGPVSMGPYVLSLAIAALTCAFRPTNALIWLFLGLKLLWRFQKSTREFYTYAFVAAVTVVAGNIFNALLDWLYYGRWVFPMGKFVLFNVVQSLSRFYGVSPWHYYLSQGLPLVLLGYLPVTLWAMWHLRSSCGVQQIVFVLSVYSLLAHKEFRFILPLVPLMHVYFSVGMSRLASHVSAPRALFAFFAFINMVIAIYLGRYHQRGVVDVVDWIRHEPSVTSVGILMPCHSTPWQSHIHRSDIDAWFLTCEPPIDSAVIAGNSFSTDRQSMLYHDEDGLYFDEADQFYWDPLAFLQAHIPSDRDWPSHIIFFDNLRPTIDEFFDGYEEVARFFNSHFHDDWRRRGDVVVYAQTSIGSTG
jgi:phosphatidylinositol glycan class B